MEVVRRKYDKEYKLMIVELVDSGQKASVVAKEYGLNDNMIRRWRREFKESNKPCFTGNANISQTAQEKEIADLKKALKEAELERDILKKAVGIFSQNDKTSMNL
jgi:transposase